MRYYECSSPSGTERIEASDKNLAAYLAIPKRSRNISVRSDDGSFRLTTRGAMIETCSDMKFLERLRPLIVEQQLMTAKIVVKPYRAEDESRNSRGR